MKTTFDETPKEKGGDFFCGCGGMSTGLLQACEKLGLNLQLLAINHSTVAIRTHSINHPDVKHVCDDMENADPLTLVPEGHMLILVASPECTHFSNARGGMPMSDQSRSSAQYILRWAQTIVIDNLLIENVEEFTTWGPLYPSDHIDEKLRNRPIPERKGEYFRAFLNSLRTLGYTLDWKIINCADYGDGTTRKRFFLQAKRGLGNTTITWPRPTHAPRQVAASQNMQSWVPAKEIIDWSIPGKSIYDRKKPLKDTTIKRIYSGLPKFCGLDFVIGQQSCAAPRCVTDPIPTVATAGAISLVRPYLVHFRNNCDTKSTEEPIPTLTAGGGHVGLAEPGMIALGDYLTKYHGSHEGKSDGDTRSLSLLEPAPTLDTSNRIALARAYAIPVTHAGGPNRTLDLNDPLVTITGAHRGELALVRPYLVSYYGNGAALSIDDPLDTVTTKHRFALVDPRVIDMETFDGQIIGVLEILFRMLQWNELAAAHSFPKSYFFFGSQELKVKQIGNSVPVQTAKALCMELLKGSRK